MKRAALLAVVSSLLAAVGCVMPDQLAQIQSDVADVKKSLDAVSKSESDVAARVTALESKVGGGDVVKRTDVADLRAKLDDVVRQTTATSDKLDQVNGRVDRLSQDVQAARDAARRAAPAPTAAPSSAEPAGAPGGTAAPAAAGASAGAAAVSAPVGGSAPNPNALYTSSYADFSKGNYALAIQGFTEYAQRFPEADLADNAMYWIGECYFSQASYKEAVDAFDAMLAKYPASDKAAAANLKKGLAFVQMHQIGQGVEQLRFVATTYPGTDEARIAKDRLATLGKP